MIDIAIYHESAFEGNSTETRPLGGTETSEIYLTRELARLGFRTAIFCDCQKPGYYRGVEFVNLKHFGDYSSTYRTKVLIVQTNPKIFLQDLNATHKVYWSTGTHTVRANQPLTDPGVRAAVDEYIFLSKWQADSFIKHFKLDRKKAFITRNGVDLSLFRDRTITRERYRLIYSSEPARGLDVLLDIFPIVKKDVPELSLYIFSDHEIYGGAKGSAYEEHRKMFEKTKQPGIFNMGNVKQSDLAKEFLKSRVMAYPCHFEETSCISAIEAQAAGVPVLSTKLAALNETVVNGVTGELISGNAASWLYKMRFAGELKKLLKDEVLWNRLSLNGIERANKVHSWAMIASEWKERFKRYI